MRGFIEGALYQNLVAEREFISKAIEIIKWGREQWSDVRKEHRGAIFEDTFLRGVQAFHLECRLKVN